MTREDNVKAGGVIGKGIRAERVGDRIGSAHYTALIIALKERWKKAGREAVNRLGSVRYGSVRQCFS